MPDFLRPLARRITRMPTAWPLGSAAPLLTSCTGPLSALDPAGPSAQYAAWLWWGMFGFFAVVLVGVIGLWLYAIRRDPGEVSPAQAKRIHSRWILTGGLALPLISTLAILAAGIPAGNNMLPLMPDEGEALVIEVKAHQWWWQVRYPSDDIELANELHIPVNTPVDVHLSTADVIHSFWVPRLAGKLDTIPGRVNVLRLEAEQPGTYHGQCAEFCGLGHAHMPFTVTAHTSEAYKQWHREAHSLEPGLSAEETEPNEEAGADE